MFLVCHFSLIMNPNTSHLCSNLGNLLKSPVSMVLQLSHMFSNFNLACFDFNSGAILQLHAHIEKLFLVGRC